jgi:hypothetical protein
MPLVTGEPQEQVSTNYLVSELAEPCRPAGVHHQLESQSGWDGAQ